jgi:ATP-dependent Lon protease
VLPIGGLKEKTLAAYRAGVKTVIIPKKNEKDLHDIDPEVRENLNFIPCTTVFEVLHCALTCENKIIAIMNPTTAVSSKQCKGGAKDENKRK